MGFRGFLQKNRKAFMVVAGLILVCVSIVLFIRTVGKDGEEPQTEAVAWQGTEPTEVPATEPPEKPTVEPEATEESKSTVKAEATEESKSTVKPEATEESKSTVKPEATEEPKSTEKPKPAVESEPTVAPVPVLTEEYELIYEGISIFNSLSHYTYLKYKDSYADLYMRKLQEDTGEAIELSLWSEQKEIWKTVNSDYIEDAPLFWREDSKNLTLGQGQCYYVVELEGATYLLRYCVESTKDMVTMSYKVFGIDPIDLPGFNANEAPYDADSISIYLVTNGTIDPAVSFPTEQMTAFADALKVYMEAGDMVASTLHGVFEVGVSSDGDNPVSPFLYDIFPWIPELVARHDVNMEGVDSPKKLLAALQNVLPTSTSVSMPDVAPDGSYFITGEYYSDSDESYLTVRKKEDGYYEGLLFIDNAFLIDFTGNYQDGILTAAKLTDSSEQLPYEMSITFQNGKATVTITAALEGSFIKTGDTFILDRNEKPEEFEYLRNAQEDSKR